LTLSVPRQVLGSYLSIDLSALLIQISLSTQKASTCFRQRYSAIRKITHRLRFRRQAGYLHYFYSWNGNLKAKFQGVVTSKWSGSVCPYLYHL